jgi:hypothetical protein
MDYKELRKAAYPSVEEQLDMLWHELNTRGSVTSDNADDVASVWFNVINEVKERFPKPSGE